MISLRTHLTPARAGLALCVFLLAGGGAWAATRTSTAAIHACYAKHGGALRIASHCRKSERAVAWNRLGATGPAGATGATGATGPRGAEGPSDLFAAGTAAEALSGSYLRAGLVTVPPGSYAVDATATYFAKTASGMICLLDVEQGGVKTELDGATASAEAGKANTLALTGIASVASEAQLELRCRLQGGGAEGSIDDAHLTAMKVATLHGSLPTD